MNNRAKIELLEAALRQAKGLINGMLRGHPILPEVTEILAEVERALGALQPKTSHHDAGAVARCSYCGRYTASHVALSARLMLKCDCGLLGGWSGSFPRPTSEAQWSVGAEWVRR